ncbi:hypothetical protein [Kocuria sp. CNJ-770]|nr:hypothetical protein [Kocuria sp. CNJ-770]
MNPTTLIPKTDTARVVVRGTRPAFSGAATFWDMVFPLMAGM